MQLEHVSCDLCGGLEYRVRYRKPDNWLRLNLFEFPVVECDHCGLVYVNPRPTIESMAAFYPEGYHDDRDSEAFRKRYEAQMAMLPDLSGANVLDIGCARGDFLSYLLDHGPAFQAHGIDAFSNGVGDSRIDFMQSTFEDTGYPPDHFDVVMSWAVFEHIHHPSAYFAEAARVLKPGGKLVILVTNAESLYGRSAYSEDVPRHTYHYSARTLSSYARKSNLRLDRIVYDDRIFDGRGKGALRMLLGRLAGFTWERPMLNELKLHHRWAMKLGSLLDLMVFSSHWEAALGRNGIMIATYDKP